MFGLALNVTSQENLTEESMVKLLDDWKAGRAVKVGPQNGQRVAEGIQGKTTLKTPVKPVCRDLDAVKVGRFCCLGLP